ALPWANQVREVVIPAGRSIADACAEVEAFYESERLVCQRWVPASTQGAEPIEAFLGARGYHTERRQTMLRAHTADLPAERGVRILPARAMRKAYAELVGRDPGYAPAFREALVAAQLARLDDPQYDLFVAQRGG